MRWHSPRASAPRNADTAPPAVVGGAALSFTCGNTMKSRTQLLRDKAALTLREGRNDARKHGYSAVHPSFLVLARSYKRLAELEGALCGLVGPIQGRRGDTDRAGRATPGA